MQGSRHHVPDCAAKGRQECAPYRGQWLQPPGWAVEEVSGEFSPDTPWCRLHHFAWKLVEETEKEGQTI